MSRKRILIDIIYFIILAGLIWMGVKLFADKRYNLISVFVAVFACIPFYYAYEKRENNIHRMVILAVMTALAISGRFIFAMLPGFKPVTAIVILTGIYMGPESGFLVGSLSALISNMFFGQGPWTPFQMAAWGIIGFLAGLPGLRQTLKSRIPLAIYGFIAGFLYSVITDIWTVLSYSGNFTIKQWFLMFLAAFPYSLVYGISNVVFLMLCIKPIGRKLERIQIKHRIF